MRIFALALAGLFWTSVASADHMTGQYHGTGDVAGTTLDLRQTGRTLQGILTGADPGTLQGQSDGGDNAEGVITLTEPGIAPLQFRAMWSMQGLSLRVQGPSGTSDVFFQPASAGPPPPPPPPPPEPPPPPPPPPPPSNGGFTPVQPGGGSGQTPAQ